MYYINHIDFYSVHANMCAQKSLKRTCPGFDQIMPLVCLLNIFPIAREKLLHHKICKTKKFYR